MRLDCARGNGGVGDVASWKKSPVSVRPTQKSTLVRCGEEGVGRPLPHLHIIMKRFNSQMFTCERHNARREWAREVLTSRGRVVIMEQAYAMRKRPSELMSHKHAPPPCKLDRMFRIRLRSCLLKHGVSIRKGLMVSHTCGQAEKVSRDENPSSRGSADGWSGNSDTHENLRGKRKKGERR